MFQSLSDDDTFKPKLLKTAKKIQELSASLQHSKLRWLNKHKGLRALREQETQAFKTRKDTIFFTYTTPRLFYIFYVKKNWEMQANASFTRRQTQAMFCGEMER